MKEKTQILSPYFVALQKMPPYIVYLCGVDIFSARLVWLKTLRFFGGIFEKFRLSHVIS
jgi:hypothetical protein